MTSPVPAAANPVRLVHGTLTRFNAGCRCGACQGFYDSLYPSQPPKATPTKPAPQRRAGRGWTVRCEPAGDIVLVGADPSRHKWAVANDQIACWWTGVAGVLVCTGSTWDYIGAYDEAITVMQEAQEEAKRKMPRAVVRDVRIPGVLAPTPPPTGRQPRRASSGIKELNSQIKTLVEEMARFTSPTTVQQSEFARRYGALRDRMAALRMEFSEAEGMFEVAQAQIVVFMDQE